MENILLFVVGSASVFVARWVSQLLRFLAYWALMTATAWKLDHIYKPCQCGSKKIEGLLYHEGDTERFMVRCKKCGQITNGNLDDVPALWNEYRRRCKAARSK